MTSSRLNFIDLFAGCGGLSEGFLQSGHFNGLAHVEWELPMVQTLRNRLLEKWDHNEKEVERNVIHFDIQKTEELINGNWSDESILKFGKSNHLDTIEGGLRKIVDLQKIDLIIGGPPCQAYSIAGRAQDKNSMKDDYRNYLFESFTEVVKSFSPRAFVFENVPGMLSAKPGGIAVTKRIYDAFENIGYQILPPDLLKDAVLTASEFGVPQKRNRVIIIGLKQTDPLKLEDIYSHIDSFKCTDCDVSVKSAIGHLTRLMPLQEPRIVNNRNVSHYPEQPISDIFHKPRYHNIRDIRIFQEWIGNDMNKKSSDEKVNFYNKMIGKKSNHAKYRNLEWNLPSPTVVAHLSKDGLMFIHPDIEQSRSITIREAAILQSFPEDYGFKGSLGVCYKMIGNAVPPKFSQILATAIYEKLNEVSA